jgi:hypothetical protein
METEHIAEIRAALGDGPDFEQFRRAIALLRTHLLRTREVPNGCDYLFEGPEATLHEALQTVVATERRVGRFLRLNFVLVDRLFLLRIVAPEGCAGPCEAYFSGDF